MELLDTDELMILPTPSFIFDIITRVYIWISACCFHEYLSIKDICHIYMAQENSSGCPLMDHNDDFRNVYSSFSCVLLINV